MTKIITKNSSTAGAAPSASDLVQGELAVNVTDKKLYTKNNSNAIVALGADLASNNSTGTNNVTLGATAGEDLTSAQTACTLIGATAGKNISGSSNGNNITAVGFNALATATNPVACTALGAESLFSLTTGNFNTGIGYLAGTNITTGLSNTCLGDSAGANITTGQGNTCVGILAYASSSTVSNEFTLGGSTIASLRCNVQSISSLSDARDKTDIIDTPYGLDFINTLQPRQFTWESRNGNIKDGTVEQGFVAQELLEAAGDNKDVLNLVLDSNPDKLEATAGNLIPILVKAIQELTARVEELENN
jgi:hypothetical protein